MFLFVCLQFCGCSTDNIGVFGTFGCKTLAIMLICIGDGIRDSLVIKDQPVRLYLATTSLESSSDQPVRLYKARFVLGPTDRREVMRS